MNKTALTLAAALALGACQTTNTAWRPPPESRETKIARHCAAIADQMRIQAAQPPIVYDYRGFPQLGLAGGFAQGQARARAADLAENDCRLRYGLAPK